MQRAETPWRVYALAVVCGLLGEGALLAVISQSETAGAFLVFLFLVEAVVLGAVFGAEAGAVGAGLPVVVAGAIDYVTCESCRDNVGLVLFAVLLLGGIAWLSGRVRARYGRPPR